MSIGTSLIEIVEMVRHEAGLSPRVSDGVDDLIGLKSKIRRVQSVFYTKHDWTHLRARTSKTLSAGQRYYDFPTDPEINFDRLEDVWTLYSGEPHDVARGIDEKIDYTTHNSELDERTDPVQKWDIRFTTAEQIEVWPVPATAGTLYFRGIKALPSLINNDDVAALDDNLITLSVASEMLADSNPNESARLAQAAAELYSALTSNASKGRKTSMSGGRRRGMKPYHAIIRVS